MFPFKRGNRFFCRFLRAFIDEFVEFRILQFYRGHFGKARDVSSSAVVVGLYAERGSLLNVASISWSRWGGGFISSLAKQPPVSQLADWLCRSSTPTIKPAWPGAARL